MHPATQTSRVTERRTCPLPDQAKLVTAITNRAKRQDTGKGGRDPVIVSNLGDRFLVVGGLMPGTISGMTEKHYLDFGKAWLICVAINPI